MEKEKPKRTVQVMVRFTPTGAEILDKLRGDKTRQDYLRSLVAEKHRYAK